MNQDMMQDIERVLLTEEELRARVRELGAQLSKDYAGKEPVFLGILKGVVVFFADMLRAVTIPCKIDFMVVSSYGFATETSGHVVMKKDVELELEGRDVVILEDIIDSGLTLSYVCAYLRSKNPASLRICTLLDKPERRQTDLRADYIGFTIPNEFVVGCGLDYADYYRNLPFIGVLKPEVYEKK